MARITDLYLFAGPNEWEKSEALRQLKKRLFPEGETSFGCETFEGKDEGVKPETILQNLAIIPFESRRRMVLIKDVDKTPPIFQSRLLETVKRLPQGTVCVLETKETKLQGPFFEKLTLLSHLFVFHEPKEREILSWVDERASFYGKKMAPRAKEFLLEKMGRDLWKLDKALEALSTYVGGESLIGEKDLEAVTGVSLTHTSFELARAVASREALAAFAIFKRLILERERPQEIVGAVGWQLRRMLRAKELLEEGASEGEVGRSLRLRFYEEESFFESLSRFERRELEKGIGALLKVDHALKTGRGEGQEEVEAFILQLCR